MIPKAGVRDVLGLSLTKASIGLAVCLLGSLLLSAPASADSSKCGARGRPAVRTDYRGSHVVFRAVFELGRCRPLSFSSSYSLQRRQAPVKETYLGHGGCHGSDGTQCRISIRIEHPQIERAEYDLFLVYPMRRSGASGMLHFDTTCTSTLLANSCSS